ncbi:MAG TPA: TlpA disulfide reductase family protein [Gammaproteobacteria bacterium]
MRLLPLLLLLFTPPLAAWEFQPYAGGEAPPFTLEDLDGREHTLAQYRGKVLVVNFWATWCPPCVAEMPSLDRLQQALAGTPFQVLALNAGDEPFDVAMFLRRVPVEVPILLDENLVVQAAWGVKLLPTTLVVDPGGRIVYRETGEREWDHPQAVAALRALLPGGG